MNYSIAEREKEKMHSLVREIVLRPIEGKTPLSGSGAPDKRLFTGENRLYATFNGVNGLWELSFKNGTISGGLDQRFTDLQSLLDYVRAYYAKRNVEIVEVGD